MDTYWFAPGAQPHLQVPGVTGEGELCLNGASTGHPLKCKGNQQVCRTWNQTNGTPVRASGVRKTYKTKYYRNNFKFRGEFLLETIFELFFFNLHELTMYKKKLTKPAISITSLVLPKLFIVNFLSF